MKGIILAGGRGTRLLPHTKITNKHLLPVYKKPMIYYPIQTITGLGCDEVLIIAGGEQVGGFAELLGDGKDFGIRITYRVQPEAGGVAHALGCASGYVDRNGNQQIVPVILGDNYFEGAIKMPSEQTLILKESQHPERFGVYSATKRQIVEKPLIPDSNLAVTGLYFYKPRTLDQINNLKPSDRGELEITDLNNYILNDPSTEVVEYKGYWSDMGTHDTLYEVSSRVKDKDVIL